MTAEYKLIEKIRILPCIVQFTSVISANIDDVDISFPIFDGIILFYFYFF